MLFPLGSACKVRESIQRYLNVNSLQTNMFDWVLSNFDAILYFILNIDTPLKEDDFYDLGGYNGIDRAVFHKSPRFDTIHDFNLNTTYEQQMPAFLEKYNRRLNRLKMNIINNDNIDFVHLIDIVPNNRIPEKPLYVPTSHQVWVFFWKIKQINPNSKCKLHILIPPPYCKKYKCHFIVDKSELDSLQNIPNTFIHFLKQYENVEPNEDQCCHWSWNEVYQTIQQM